MKCIICGKKIKDFGNNPAPVKFEGRCCDTCNKTKVIPKRIELLIGEQNKKEYKVIH
jgi:hypothetical protein